LATTATAEAATSNNNISSNSNNDNIINATSKDTNLESAILCIDNLYIVWPEWAGVVAGAGWSLAKNVSPLSAEGPPEYETEHQPLFGMMWCLQEAHQPSNRIGGVQNVWAKLQHSLGRLDIDAWPKSTGLHRPFSREFFTEVFLRQPAVRRHLGRPEVPCDHPSTTHLHF
jgi:hypothetical protein